MRVYVYVKNENTFIRGLSISHVNGIIESISNIDV